MSDRQDRGGQNYYDAQYGLAPFLLSEDERTPNLYVLEFITDKKLKDYCNIHQLNIIAQRGNMVLALPRA